MSSIPRSFSFYSNILYAGLSRGFNMLHTARSQPWTCRVCLQRLQRLQRSNTERTFATAVAADQQQASVDFAAASRFAKQRDDETLRRVFDSRPFWREFSHRRANSSKRTGIVQNQYLSSPEGFRQFAQTSLQKCQRIVSKVLGASTLEDYRSMAKDLDRLSDLLCRVIDLSDFVRGSGPSERTS